MSVTVTVLKNGPLQIKEEVTIVDGVTGAEIKPEKFPVYICRCGASKNKPFCDGAHGKAAFDGTCGKVTP